MTSRAVQRMAAQRFPEAHVIEAEVAGERAWAALPASPPAQPARRGRDRGRSRTTRLLVAACLAVALALVPWSPRGAAFAATPELLTYTAAAGTQNPETVLRALAATARTQWRPRGDGPYHYIKSRGWYLATSSLDGAVIDSRIAVVERQMWVARDGSGELRVSDGTPHAPNRRYGPGELSGIFVDGTAAESLRAELGPGLAAPRLFEAVRGAWSGQAVPGATQAAMLELLAGMPNLDLLGDTVDRAGRRGIAVATTRHTTVEEQLIMVLSPHTGALLDYETVVLEPSDLPVRAPATIGYTVFVDSGRCATTGELPVG